MLRLNYYICFCGACPPWLELTLCVILERHRNFNLTARNEHYKKEKDYRLTNLNNTNPFIHNIQRHHLTSNEFMGYRIIRTALVIVFSFLSNGIKAQPCDTLAKRFPGAVILRAERKKDMLGPSCYGCIQLMNGQEMYAAPKLVDSLGKTDRFFGREALAYWYIRNNDTIYYLNSGRNLSQYKWIYMERIAKGPMELYFFKLQGTSLLTMSRSEYSYYYLRKDGRWLNKKAIVWNEGGKRKQLNMIFSDCKPALELISKSASLQLDEIIKELVTLYNNSCYNNK